jgi:hypothetical protein
MNRVFGRDNMLNRPMSCSHLDSCRRRRLLGSFRPLDPTFAAGNRSAFAADDVLARDRSRGAKRASRIPLTVPPRKRRRRVR